MSKELELSILMNCILVDKGIRPAMLIQPQDYGEVTWNDPHTKQILDSIQTKFPRLKQSHHYEKYQGIIVSKQNFNGKTIDNTEMGRILGYPCYEDYETSNSEDVEYTQSLMAQLPGEEDDADAAADDEPRYRLRSASRAAEEDDAAAEDEPRYRLRSASRAAEEDADAEDEDDEDEDEDDNTVTLLANVCKNNRYQSFMEDMAVRAQKVIRTYPGLEKVNVFIEHGVKVPITMVIRKLITRTELNQDDKASLINTVANIGSTNYEYAERVQNAIQYDNPVHQGILISMLLDTKYDPSQIFYALQNHEQTAPKFDEIMTIRDQLLESVGKVLELTQMSEMSQTIHFEDPLIDQLIQGNLTSKGRLIKHLIQNLILLPYGEKYADKEYADKLYSVIQVLNPMHRGLLIFMLLLVKHNPFEPISPLAMTEHEKTAVLHLSGNIFKNFFEILEYTSEKTGGRTRRMKQRKTREKTGRTRRMKQRKTKRLN
jgi:hypothetical protein